jgi:asparagine synthase (glutamine-hydrolysing)
MMENDTALVASSSIVRGDHRFKDPELARIAAERGAAAAWSEGFARLGPDILSEVAGDFAVYLEDARGRQFAAVDRFAIHPLCYRIRGNRLEVAERADALADEGDKLGPQAVFDYFFFHVIPAPRTIHKDVARLPAAHYALMSDGKLTVARWWHPIFIEDAAVDFGELRTEFRRLLRESIGRRLDGRSVGCFLSGGTDSSTVAGLVTELSGRPAETFSIGFDVDGYDEMAYARIAARHFGTAHHEYYVTADDVVGALADIAAVYDQPFGNSSVLPAYYCAKMAVDTDMDLLLAGDGGDELFGGNARYAKQRIFEAYGVVPHPLRRGLLEPALIDWPALKHVPGFKKAASYVEQARVPMPDRMEMYNLILHLGVEKLFTPDFLAVVDTGEPLRQQRATYASSTGAALINRMLAYDWKYTLADNDLPKVVGATAIAGIAVAFPLLDDVLVDFSLRLAPQLKLRGSKLRWFFKEALRGFLPDPILAKKKHGFGLPFGFWATTHSGLRQLVRERLDAFAARGIVRGPFIDRLASQYLPAHPGYYGELVWLLVVLESWLSSHRREVRA